MFALDTREGLDQNRLILFMSASRDQDLFSARPSSQWPQARWLTCPLENLIVSRIASHANDRSPNAELFPALSIGLCDST